MRRQSLPSPARRAGEQPISDTLSNDRETWRMGERGMTGASPRPPSTTSMHSNKQNNERRRQSAKPRSPLKHSIPEFPTKVGGHHMSGSTDPARDSSLKDR